MTQDMKRGGRNSGRVDVDGLMQELGQFRRFHLWNYVLLALVSYVVPLHAMNYVFLVGNVPYRYEYYSLFK